MGAKSWFIAFVTPGKQPVDVLISKPQLDRAASEALAKKLFPSLKPVSTEDGNLAWTCPRRGEVLVACFQDLTIIANEEFAKDPRKIPKRFISAAEGRDIYVHVMISTVDWFSFAIWRGGRLIRFLSVAPDSGIEEQGERLEFELPFWAGRYTVEDGDDYPLPFHPLEMGEIALLFYFGFCIEGGPSEYDIDEPIRDASSVSLPMFRKIKPWWWPL